MKVKTSNGTVLESSNKLVIEQWKKHGYKDISAVKAADATKNSEK